MHRSFQDSMVNLSFFLFLHSTPLSFLFLFSFLHKWMHVIDSTRFKFLFRISVLGLRDAEAKYDRRESLSRCTLIFRKLSHDNHANVKHI